METVQKTVKKQPANNVPTGLQDETFNEAAFTGDMFKVVSI